MRAPPALIVFIMLAMVIALSATAGVVRLWNWLVPDRPIDAPWTRAPR